MKVKELIDKLAVFDPNMTVVIEDSEHGTEGIGDPYVDEAYYEYPDKAKVICIPSAWESYKVDEEYVIKGEPVKHTPTPFMDALVESHRDQLQRQLHPTFYKDVGTPRAGGEVVTFKIIRGDE